VAAKSQQLQIRIAPAQKAALRRLARSAGLDVSSYVLARLLPPEQGRFSGLLREMANEADRRFALAELHDLLRSCAPAQFPEAVAVADLRDLPAWLQNYVAAMVDQAAEQKRLAPPAWTGNVTARGAALRDAAPEPPVASARVVAGGVQAPQHLHRRRHRRAGLTRAAWPIRSG
jgi:hypothetical protein